jgi:hypothetical protein
MKGHDDRGMNELHFETADSSTNGIGFSLP